MALAEWLLAASNASTAREYVLPQDRPRKVVLVDGVVPTDAPSRYVPYPATPTLSADAVHEIVMLAAAEDVTFRPVGTVGACVSPGGGGGSGGAQALVVPVTVEG